MTVLNITYNGQSADYPIELDAHVTDSDIRRIAVEILRAPQNAFDGFVVDRFDGAQGGRIYLRPKVPFGSA